MRFYRIHAVECVDEPSSSRKRKRSPDLAAQNISKEQSMNDKPNEYYIPTLSNTVISSEDLDEVLQTYHSDWHNTEIDVFRIRFVNSLDTRSAGEKKEVPDIAREVIERRIIETNTDESCPMTTLQVTEHQLRIDLPRVFRSALKNDYLAEINTPNKTKRIFSFFVISQNEQKILQAIAVATQFLKKYFLDSDFLPCDVVEETPDAKLVRRCRLFFFEVDDILRLSYWYDAQEIESGEQGDNGSQFLPVDISPSFSKNVDKEYLIRCLAQHVLFTFKNTIKENTISNTWEGGIPSGKIFNGTPFYGFLSDTAEVRESLTIGVNSAIDVVKLRAERLQAGKDVEKLFSWIQSPMIEMEVEHDKVMNTLESSMHENMIYWASSTESGRENFTRHYDSASELWKYEFPPLAIDPLSHSPHSEFLNKIYPLTKTENRVLTDLFKVFREFFLSLSSASSSSQLWTVVLPSLSDLTSLIEIPGLVHSSQGIRWNVVLRYIPLTLQKTSTILKKELEKDNRFHEYDATWPKRFKLVPPAYYSEEKHLIDETSYYDSLKIGLENLRDIEQL